MNFVGGVRVLDAPVVKFFKQRLEAHAQRGECVINPLWFIGKKHSINQTVTLQHSKLADQYFLRDTVNIVLKGTYALRPV